MTVNRTPPIMADDEEAVEHAEGNRGHRKEIHGCNGFPMVSKRWCRRLSFNASLLNILLPPPYRFTDRGHRESFSPSGYCRTAQNFRNEKGQNF
jgi:hypothetical protein